MRSAARSSESIARSGSPNTVEQAFPTRALENRHERSVVVERIVDKERLALHVGLGHEAPVPAVFRVVAIVAHHEILVGRHGHGAIFLAQVVGARRSAGGRWLE